MCDVHHPTPALNNAIVTLIGHLLNPYTNPGCCKYSASCFGCQPFGSKRAIAWSFYSNVKGQYEHIKNTIPSIFKLN